MVLVAAPDAQADWMGTNGPYAPVTRAFTFASKPARLLAGTAGGGVFVANPSYTGWSATNDGITHLDVTALTTGTNEWGDEIVLAGTVGGGVFASWDSGATWLARNSGLLMGDVVRAVAVIADPYFGDGMILFRGEDAGVWRSNTGGRGVWWWPVSTGLTNRQILSFTSAFDGSDEDDGAGARDLYAGTNGGGVFVSIDGVFWTAKRSGLTNPYVPALAQSSSYGVVFAGTAGSGVFVSTSTYGDWSPINAGLTDPNVRALAAAGTTVFAATDSGVFVATDDGASGWRAFNAGLPDLRVAALATDGVNLFAATLYGVYRRPLAELSF